MRDRTSTLSEGFRMLYDRFVSNERRDRLLQKWNNLKFSDFMKTPAMCKHSALQELYLTASYIQAQLVASYQDDQHLRDAMMNACRNETWSQKLVTMPTAKLLDVQESLAKAISAEEDLESVQKSTQQVPAFPNDVDFSQDRPGMPYRRYGENLMNFKNPKFRDFGQKNGKNPIRGAMRLLCRACFSDENLLRSCPNITPAKRVKLTKHVFAIDSVTSNSVEFNDALEHIQQFNDQQWDDCVSAIDNL